MKDMISKIIDMDQKARDVTSEAQKSKVDASQEVALIKEKIRDNYLSRARERIKANKKAARNAAIEEWKITSEKHKKIMENLETIYSQKCDEWVSTIVQRVIEE